MMLIGTSGWQYSDWREILYPRGLSQRRWLERYAECFGTVENNNAFLGWAYLRLHEGAARPWPDYGDRALQSWLDRLAGFRDTGDVHVCFNNDPGGAAVRNATRFEQLASNADWLTIRT